MSISCALGVVLHKGHYQYVTARLSDDLIQLLPSSTTEATPDLTGGGHALVSWNVGSMSWQEVLSFSTWQVACLQETGTTTRNQKFVVRQFAERKLSVVWGSRHLKDGTRCLGSGH